MESRRQKLKALPNNIRPVWYMVAERFISNGNLSNIFLSQDFSPSHILLIRDQYTLDSPFSLQAEKFPS